MKRVLITGATGFVGGNLAHRLVRDGHEVHLLVRPRSIPWRLAEIWHQVRPYDVDLTDQAATLSVVDHVRPGWVFHLAAHGAYSFQTDVTRIVESNLLGTIHLLDACLQVGFEAFVNAGSSSEYGFKDHAPTETDWLDPNSPYAVSKAAATHYCRHIALSRRARVVTLRLYSVYGHYEEPTRLIPTLISRGLNGQLPSLARPEIARDYVYAEDVNDAFLLAAGHPAVEPGAVYNVGTGIQTTLAEVVQIARRRLGIHAEPVWGSMADRCWDTTSWVADCRRIHEQLGWRPRHGFEEGFLRTVEWLQRNPELLAYYRTSLASVA
jgi:nucleoside-diphosphate-sugar epimerase